MKKLYTLSLCFALLVLAACSENLFGSSSSGSGSDIKSLRIDAENAFRKGKFEESFNICKKITGIDPASSFGYYGMAKAGLWWKGVNPLSMFSLIKPKEGECPFMREDVKVRNNYLQAMKKIIPALSELDRRDSLTDKYELYIQAKKSGGSLDERLYEFGEKFCAGTQNCRDTINNNEKFPLSDREYKSSYFGGILLLSSFSKWFLNFFDTNKDSCLARSVGSGEPGIDYPSNDYSSSEWGKWGCNKSVKKEKSNDSTYSGDLSVALTCPKDEYGNMSVVIDSKQILDDLQNTLQDYYKDVANCREDCESKVPDEIKGFNDKINDFGDDFADVEDVLNSLGLGGSGDPDFDQGSLKDEIDKYKVYSAFYKMGTHFDEDGDGCIDEELLDGLDNDGDGFVNENSRLSPTDPSDPYYGTSPMNNCMVGNDRYKNSVNWEYNKPVSFTQPVKICNSPDCSIYTMLPLNEEGLVTVLNFTQKGYPNGTKYWTSNVANLKLEVALDKNCAKYNLKYRQDNIGGCWPYYDNNKFDVYCRSR